MITVLDRADMMADSGVLNEDAGPRVVAEWHGHTDPDLLAIKCAQIASFYNNALLIVENNTAYSKLNDVDTDNVSELFFPILIPLYDNVYAHNRSELEKGARKKPDGGLIPTVIQKWPLLSIWNSVCVTNCG